MKLKKKITKDFSVTPVDELSESPVYALYGISDRNALALYKAFHVDTIEDLANLKYFQWAREICNLADSGQKSIDVDYFSDKLIKKYRKLSPAEIADSPLHALYGLSRKNARLLNKSFNLHTIRDLATLKYVSWARSIDYKHRLVADYEDRPLEEVIDAPVHALQGLSSKKAKILSDKIGLDTIRDLAEYNYARLAHRLCNYEKRPEDYNPIEYESSFTKQYRDKTIKQILKAPVTAFQGLGKKEATAISNALGAKTLKSLGTNKYYRWARDILDLNNAARSLQVTPERKAGKRAPFKPATVIIAIVIIIIAALAAYLYNKSITGETDKKIDYTSTSTETISHEKPTVIEDQEETVKPVKPEKEEKEDKEEYISYRIEEGDTLVIISEKIYGTYKRWPEIYKMNKGIIEHPAKIFPGHTIKLPPKK